ncbi:hypothetical protein pb186bvf_000006 [Paramecium bursaria]
MRVMRQRYLSPQERVRSPPQIFNKLKQIGKYFYDKSQIIGRGQYSVVYKGYQEDNQQNLVAVKVIQIQQNNELQQFMINNEISILSKIKSPNVVKLLYHTQVQGFVYLVTQYYSRGDLMQRISQNGPLPEDEALRVILQIGKALREMHKQQIVHGDVKSANILQGDQYVLGDFGFACQIEQAQQIFIIGTPLYMAPEVLLDNKCTCGADVWSLGCVLYELVNGQVPFYSYSQNKLLQDLEQYKEIQVISYINQNVSKKICSLINMMLQYDVSKRCSIDDIINLLEPQAKKVSERKIPENRLRRDTRDQQDKRQISQKQISLLDLVQYFNNSYQMIKSNQNIFLNFLYLKLVNIYYQAYLQDQSSNGQKIYYIPCQNEFFELENLIRQDHSDILQDEQFQKFFNGNFNISQEFIEYILKVFKTVIMDCYDKQIKDKLIANIAIIDSLFESKNSMLDQTILRLHRMKSQ